MPRCMMAAEYFCSGEQAQEEWHHYGLAAPIYTHFTSPIRRYADVCVHRLLGAAIGVAPLPTFLMDKVGTSSRDLSFVSAGRVEPTAGIYYRCRYAEGACHVFP